MHHSNQNVYDSHPIYQKVNGSSRYPSEVYGRLAIQIEYNTVFIDVFCFGKEKRSEEYGCALSHSKKIAVCVCVSVQWYV